MSNCFSNPPPGLRLPIAPVGMCLFACFFSRCPQRPGPHGYLCPAPLTLAPLPAGGPAPQRSVNHQDPCARCHGSNAAVPEPPCRKSIWQLPGLRVLLLQRHGKSVEKESWELRPPSHPAMVGHPLFQLAFAAGGACRSQHQPDPNPLHPPRLHQGNGEPKPGICFCTCFGPLWVDIK